LCFATAYKQISFLTIKDLLEKKTKKLGLKKKNKRTASNPEDKERKKRKKTTAPKARVKKK